MSRPPLASGLVAVGLAALLAGCSSGQEGNRGSLVVKLSASRTEAAPEIAAATVRISGIEARRADGTWAPVQNGLPVDVDIMSLSRSGTVLSLPADLLPEGHCTALQLRLTSLAVALAGEGRKNITAPGAGWTAIVPVDFAVDVDHSTTVGLLISPDRSIRRVGDDFEFDPDLEVRGVDRE